MNQLLDRIAIITGAGTEIGKAIAIASAEEGAKVVLASINPTKINTIANAIIQVGKTEIFIFYRSSPD